MVNYVYSSNGKRHISLEMSGDLHYTTCGVVKNGWEKPKHPIDCKTCFAPLERELCKKEKEVVEFRKQRIKQRKRSAIAKEHKEKNTTTIKNSLPNRNAKRNPFITDMLKSFGVAHRQKYKDFVRGAIEFEKPKPKIKKLKDPVKCVRCREFKYDYFKDEYTTLGRSKFCVDCGNKYGVINCKMCYRLLLTGQSNFCPKCRWQKNTGKYNKLKKPVKPKGNREKIYYVYVWYWNGIPRYVGKGKNNRAYDFDRENHNNYNLSNALAQCKPDVEIVKDQLTEYRALKIEQELILKYGRLDLGLGKLYNLTDGFEGFPYHSPGTFVGRSPQGKLYWIKGLKGFCNQHNLSQGNASNVAHGTYGKSTKGWKFWTWQRWIDLPKEEKRKYQKNAR